VGAARGTPLERFLEDLTRRAGYSITPNTLLADWERLVAQVERGYRHNWYEYSHELSSRRVIDALLDLETCHLPPKFAERVRSLDERFVAVTVPMPAHLRVTDHPLTERIPIKPRGELKRDLHELCVDGS